LGERDRVEFEDNPTLEASSLVEPFFIIFSEQSVAAKEEPKKGSMLAEGLACIL
jgi:hypothetical protein